LIDFGDARIIHPQADPTFVTTHQGSIEFSAPEQLNASALSLKTDIWSLGAVTYVLLSGLSPFLDETLQETRANIFAADLHFPEEYFRGISDGAKRFIQATIDLEPSERPAALECTQYLWFQTHDQHPPPLSIDQLASFVERRRNLITNRDLLMPT